MIYFRLEIKLLNLACNRDMVFEGGIRDNPRLHTCSNGGLSSDEYPLVGYEKDLPTKPDCWDSCLAIQIPLSEIDQALSGKYQ